MQILLVLIPVSLLLLGAAVGMFFWAVRHGQFENLDRAALDVLVDEPSGHGAPAAQRPGTGSAAVGPEGPATRRRESGGHAG